MFKHSHLRLGKFHHIKPRVPWFYKLPSGPLRMSKNSAPNGLFVGAKKGPIGDTMAAGLIFYTVDFFWKDLKWCRISEASTFLASHVKENLHPTMSNKKCTSLKHMSWMLNIELCITIHYVLWMNPWTKWPSMLHCSFFASTYCHNMLQPSHFRDFGYIII